MVERRKINLIHGWFGAGDRVGWVMLGFTGGGFRDTAAREQSDGARDPGDGDGLLFCRRCDNGDDGQGTQGPRVLDRGEGSF